MFPIKDENPTRTFPFVNYLLIAANIAAYVWETLLIQQGGEVAVVSGYGLVARRLLTDPAGEAFTVFTSMFMHGGLAHLGGNMLFLYIFGDNVEDTLGHKRYIGFYLLAGIAIGPFGMKLVDKVEDVRHFAELGVVFLLFVIGLELEPKRLWHMRGRLLSLGLSQVIGTVALIAAVALLSGLNLRVGLIAGMALALSSTALALQPFPRTAGAASSLMGATQFAVGAVVSAALGAMFDGSARPMASAAALAGLGAFLVERSFLRGPR